MLAAKNADICSRCLVTEPCVRSFIRRQGSLNPSLAQHASAATAAVSLNSQRLTAIETLMLWRSAAESEEELRQRLAFARQLDEGSER